jgi:hypothetical protein
MANTSWSTTDKSAGATLSGGNLTVSFTSGAQGIRAVDSHNSGKFYFEVICTTLGTNTLIGLATSGTLLTTVASTTSGAAGVYGSGAIWVNGVSSGVSIGAIANGNTVGVAIDFGARKIWFRPTAAGNWNGNASYVPGVSGGVDSGTGPGINPYPLVAVTGGTAALTANFGDSAFTGTVPSGFTAGWPGGAGPGTNALVTQVATEEWVLPIAQARLTQLALEQWGGGAAAQLTQLGLEQWVTGSASTQAILTQLGLEQWAVLPPSFATGGAGQTAVTVVT